MAPAAPTSDDCEDVVGVTWSVTERLDSWRIPTVFNANPVVRKGLSKSTEGGRLGVGETRELDIRRLKKACCEPDGSELRLDGRKPSRSPNGCNKRLGRRRGGQRLTIGADLRTNSGTIPGGSKERLWSEHNKK